VNKIFNQLAILDNPEGFAKSKEVGINNAYKVSMTM
jgi:hypothetical protein